MVYSGGNNPCGVVAPPATGVGSGYFVANLGNTINPVSG
jgi:hypothetical protein